MSKAGFRRAGLEHSILTGCCGVRETLTICSETELLIHAGPDFARVKREAPLLTSSSTHAARRQPSCEPRRMRPSRNAQNAAVFPHTALGLESKLGLGV